MRYTDYSDYQEPAKSIIVALGGPANTARSVGAALSTVTRWARPCGCNGQIPLEWLPKIEQAFAHRGLKFRPEYIITGLPAE